MSDEREQVTLAQAVKNLRENLPALLEMELINAKVTRQKFLSLRAEGFTEAQALDLCRKS